MVFWTTVCCWVIELDLSLKLIAGYLIISETALFIIAKVAGDKLFELTNGFYSYPANVMYFPVVAFVFEIIACLCLIAGAIWHHVMLAGVWLGYQVLEFIIFTFIVLDGVLGDDETPDELVVTTVGGPRFFLFQFITVFLRIYFMYIVVSWMLEIMDSRAASREEARARRLEARLARMEQRDAKAETFARAARAALEHHGAAVRAKDEQVQAKKGKSEKEPEVKTIPLH